MTQIQSVHQACVNDSGCCSQDVSRVARGGGEKTRKTIFAALATCMLVALSALSMSVAAAEESMAVQGSMVWDLNTLEIIRAISAGPDPVHCNTILWGTTTVYVTGDFAGTATDIWKETLFRTGAFNLVDKLTVKTSLDGKSGTLTMLLVGRAAPPGDYWTGQWTILSGTGDLATTSGHGTWWTAGVGYDFSGEVEFV